MSSAESSSLADILTETLAGDAALKTLLADDRAAHDLYASITDAVWLRCSAAGRVLDAAEFGWRAAAAAIADLRGLGEGYGEWYLAGDEGRPSLWLERHLERSGRFWSPVMPEDESPSVVRAWRGGWRRDGEAFVVRVGDAVAVDADPRSAAAAAVKEILGAGRGADTMVQIELRPEGGASGHGTPAPIGRLALLGGDIELALAHGGGWAVDRSRLVAGFDKPSDNGPLILAHFLHPGEPFRHDLTCLDDLPDDGTPLAARATDWFRDRINPGLDRPFQIDRTIEGRLFLATSAEDLALTTTMLRFLAALAGEGRPNLLQVETAHDGRPCRISGADVGAPHRQQPALRDFMAAARAVVADRPIAGRIHILSHNDPVLRLPHSRTPRRDAFEETSGSFDIIVGKEPSGHDMLRVTTGLEELAARTTGKGAEAMRRLLCR